MMDGRKCTKCGAVKPVGEFYLRGPKFPDRRQSACKACHVRQCVERAKLRGDERREYVNAWRDRNRERYNEYHRAYRERNPEKARENHLWTTYGIRTVEYQAMLASQHGQCGICKCAPDRGQKLVVDHCHRTGRVRGLLCNDCNQVLGRARDEIPRLAAAIGYLDRGPDFGAIRVTVSSREHR